MLIDPFRFVDPKSPLLLERMVEKEKVAANDSTLQWSAAFIGGGALGTLIWATREASSPSPIRSRRSRGQRH